MASRPKLTVDTLKKLGARKLAELLLAEAAGNRPLKQALSSAISAQEGPAAVAASLHKRLIVIANVDSIHSYERGREMIAELEGLRTTITETVGDKDPNLALDLLWQLLDLHPSIFERVDDSSGRVGSVFRAACSDLGPIAEAARIEPHALAATVLAKVMNNGYGIYDGLIVSLNEALGKKGLADLRALLLQRREEYLTIEKRAAIDAGRFDHTLSALSLALRDIADCEGDADAFIDTYQGREPALRQRNCVATSTSGPSEGGVELSRPSSPVAGEQAFCSSRVDGCTDCSARCSAASR